MGLWVVWKTDRSSFNRYVAEGTNYCLFLLVYCLRICSTKLVLLEWFLNYISLNAKLIPSCHFHTNQWSTAVNSVTVFPQVLCFSISSLPLTDMGKWGKSFTWRMWSSDGVKEQKRKWLFILISVAAIMFHNTQDWAAWLLWQQSCRFIRKERGSFIGFSPKDNIFRTCTLSQMYMGISDSIARLDE